jgi:hypothetical protein
MGAQTRAEVSEKSFVAASLLLTCSLRDSTAERTGNYDGQHQQDDADEDEKARVARGEFHGLQDDKPSAAAQSAIATMRARADIRIPL